MPTLAARCALALAVVLAVTALDLPVRAVPAPSPFPVSSPSASATPAPQTNPFSSPTPVPRTNRQNGYVTGGYLFGSATGGEIAPQPGSTHTPTPFPNNASQTGFWADILGRLGTNYLASLEYEEARVDGGDRPFVSYAQLRALYEPTHATWAFGIGLLSAQRSTQNANLNSFGPGVALLPNPANRLSPYAWAFYYPHVETRGSSSSLFAAQAGLQFAPAPKSGFFVRAGVTTHCCFPTVTSPKSDFSTQIGIGSSF
ncbi:MAG TPA: hypothetical protein VEJ41_05610 [Candidatus Acidoferrales bacterium]|nr:hypothetical protein [Candidatus Acidoferrales bacterium]